MPKRTIERTIEVIDEVNNSVHHIDAKTEIVFHPNDPEYPIVIQDLLEEYGIRESGKTMGTFGIIFKRDGSTMVLMKKEVSAKNITYIGKSSEIDPNNIIITEKIGYSVIDGNYCVCFVIKNDLYIFPYEKIRDFKQFLKDGINFLRDQPRTH